MNERIMDVGGEIERISDGNRCHGEAQKKVVRGKIDLYNHLHYLRAIKLGLTQTHSQLLCGGCEREKCTIVERAATAITISTAAFTQKNGKEKERKMKTEMGDNEANFLDNLALNLIIVPYNYSDLDEHNICVYVCVRW